MNDKIVESLDGFKWYVGGPETDDHLALGGHEPGLGVVLEVKADPGKLFINVGAHVGTWVIRLADKFEYTYAFEANENTAARLSDNIVLNNLDSKIAVFNVALWDKDDEFVQLIDANNKLTGGSTRAELLSEDYVKPNIRPTETVRLDSYYMPGLVGTMLIDVEGAEARVLRGAKETIARDKPFIVVELHEGHPGTDADLRQQVYDVLDELDYHYYENNINGEIMLFCTFDELDDPEPTATDLQPVSDDDIIAAMRIFD